MEKCRSTEEIVYSFRDSPTHPDLGGAGKVSQTHMVGKKINQDSKHY